LIDYHVHERHSRDTSSATVENYVRAAEERGIDEVAFTTHLITAGPDVDIGIRLHEIPEYLEEIQRAQETTKVRLLAGLEVDYFPQEERRLERILGEHSLDIVLGSTHYVNGVDIGSRRQVEEFFAGRPISEGADEYYTVWRRAIESGLFDVMAHPDYWRKYIHIFRQPVGWDDFGSVVYDCLDSLVSHGVGIEVNTSGHRHGVGGNFPLQQFLDAAYKAGVKTVTVGSDSHTPSQLGYRLVEAVEQLRKAGYSTLSSFRRRKNHAIPI
jgi:histidinol-phosphatase (PHP family)